MITKQELHTLAEWELATDMAKNVKGMEKFPDHLLTTWPATRRRLIVRYQKVKDELRAGMLKHMEADGWDEPLAKEDSAP